MKRGGWFCLCFYFTQFVYSQVDTLVYCDNGIEYRPVSNQLNDLPYHLLIREGLSDGYWLGYSPNKKDTLLFEGEILNGQRQGVWKTYWPNAKVQYHVSYRSGCRHGKWLCFQSNGIKLVEGQFSNEQAIGLWYLYDSAGFLCDSTDYGPTVPKRDSIFSALSYFTTYPALAEADSIYYSPNNCLESFNEELPLGYPTNLMRSICGIHLESYYYDANSWVTEGILVVIRGSKPSFD